MCKVITKSRKKDRSSVKAEKEGKGRKKEKHTHAQKQIEVNKNKKLPGHSIEFISDLYYFPLGRKRMKMRGVKKRHAHEYLSYKTE